MRETRQTYDTARDAESEALLGDTLPCREHRGDIRISTKADMRQLELVRVLTGSLRLTPAEALSNLSDTFDASLDVREVTGDFVLGGTRDQLVGAHVSFSSLTTVGGDLEITYTTRGLVDLYRLQSVGGAFIANHGGWGLWTPALRAIGGGIDIADTSSLGLNFDALETVGGPIRVERAAGLERLLFGKLESIDVAGADAGPTGESIVIIDNSELTAISFGRLRRVDGDVRITGNPRLPRAKIEVAFAGITVTGTTTICGNGSDEACK